MVRNFKRIVSAAAIVAAGGAFSAPAFAEAKSLDLGTFTYGTLEALDPIDYLFFTLTGPSDLFVSGMTGFASAFETAGLFAGSSVLTPSSPSFGVKPNGFGFTFDGLAAGSYTLAVKGIGSYVIMSSATPVPEPESLALMLAGAGVVGWSLRRRRLPD